MKLEKHEKKNKQKKGVRIGKPRAGREINPSGSGGGHVENEQAVTLQCFLRAPYDRAS